MNQERSIGMVQGFVIGVFVTLVVIWAFVMTDERDHDYRGVPCTISEECQ